MEEHVEHPFYVPKASWGYKYGNGEFVDGPCKDGLTDVYDQCAMGVLLIKTAAEKYNISREEQDAFAIDSYKRSAATTEAGQFASEIVPVSIPQRKGDPKLMSEDEEFRKVMFEKIPSLRAAFTQRRYRDRRQRQHHQRRCFGRGAGGCEEA